MRTDQEVAIIGFLCLVLATCFAVALDLSSPSNVVKPPTSSESVEN